VADETKADDRPAGRGSSEEMPRHLANWRDEVDSQTLYGALADLEPEPRLAEVYRRLAATEGRHAGLWEQRLRARGARVPECRPGWRTRVLIAVARRFGNQMVLPTLNDLERADSRGYDEQPDSRGTAMPAEERSHARCCDRWRAAPASRARPWVGWRAATAPPAGTPCWPPCSAPTTGCCRTSVSSWVSRARRSRPTPCWSPAWRACWPARGQWPWANLSRLPARGELAGHQLDIEAREIEQIPDEEREELALIYEAKGLNADHARDLAARQIADRETALPIARPL
jgi:vacuolar iron transporter family protein